MKWHLPGQSLMPRVQTQRVVWKSWKADLLLVNDLVPPALSRPLTLVPSG